MVDAPQSIYRCDDCGGTGIDRKQTDARPKWESGYVACRNCMGNGLDPAKVFYDRERFS